MTVDDPETPGGQPQQPGGQPPQPPPQPQSPQSPAQPAYGQPPQPAPGFQPPPPGTPGQYPPAQPGFQPRGTPTSATVSLILGIVGLLLCFLCAPFAWWQGQVAKDEIDRSGGALDGRGMAQAGYILGIIGSIWGALVIVFIIVLVIVGATSS